MTDPSPQTSAPGQGAVPAQGRRPHSPVEGFRPHTYVDGIYSLVNPQCGTAKNGKHFLKGMIRDATGEVPIRQWTFDESQLAEISRTGFVWLGGQAQEYNGQLQVIVDSISAVEVELEDLARLLPASRHDIPAMEQELRRILGSLAHPGMRALAEGYLSNEALMSRLRQAPAAVSVHHAWIGGLLEHTLQLMRIAEVALPLYPELNRDIVLMGLFLHDLGKTTELAWEKGFTYTAEGNLLGHTVKGAIMLSAMAARVARETGHRIPPEALLVLQHIVVSHHGSLEFGATKVPSTPEAIFVANLDNLDAKTAVALHAAQRSRPIQPGQEFTERVWSLDTRIYRPDPLTWDGNGSSTQDG
jgi:3'-5' exoribonuclease